MANDERPANETDGEEPPADDAASVVLIDRTEDIAAVCGRVDSVATWAVVVHAPAGNRQLSTELGMRRLLHHADDSGKVLAFATRSGALASRARSLGVPVARKPHEVRWDAGGKHVARVGRLGVVVPSFGRYVQVAIFAAVAFAGVFLVFALGPSATITAYPPTEKVATTVAVTASESRTEVNLETLEVPAARVSAERVVTLAVRTTGTAQVGTAPAKAKVTVTNSTQAMVVVAAGSVVLAAPGFAPFVFEATLEVPPGGSAEGAVTARKPGVEGNVPAGAITGWEAERLRFLGVTNAAPAAGGVSEPRPAVAAADGQALSALAEQLKNAPELKEWLAELRPGDAVFSNTLTAETRRGDVRPAAGTPAEMAFLEVTVRISALAVTRESLEQVARHALADTEEDGELIEGTVRAKESGAATLDAETATLRAEFAVEAEAARGVTRDEIRDAVKGKTEDGARSTLQERYGIEETEVRRSGWAPRLPLFGFRITVKLAAR